MKKKGSITVFLLLLLSVLVLLTGAVLFSVRHRGARTMVKTAARQSVMDLFSNYEPTLFREYGLLFMDAGFGSDTFRPGLMLDSVEQNAGILWGDGSLASNIWGLAETKAALRGYTLATDQKGEAFYRQAVQTAKEDLTAEAVRILKQQVRAAEKQETVGQTQGDVKKACEKYQSVVEKAQEGELKNTGEKAEKERTDPAGEKEAEPCKDNPIETVKKLQKKGVLGLVMPAQREMSSKRVKKAKLVSGRSLQTGIGLEVAAGLHKEAEQLLYTGYLGNHLSSFTEPDETAELSWQLEYVFAGKTTDKENLKKTVDALLLLREGANLVYLKSDSKKMSQVHAMAASIAAALAVPVSEGVISTVLCVCWAYGESLMDIRTLLAGGNVPVLKDNESWQLELSSLSSVEKQKAEDAGKGLDYTGYLQILLGMKTGSKQILRGMDMVELGMRGKAGCTGFRFDHCIEAARIEIQAQVKGAGTVSAMEYRSYEN